MGTKYRITALTSHDLKATELAMTIKVSIQWLHLAANGCKTYLNLNLNRAVRLEWHGLN